MEFNCGAHTACAGVGGCTQDPCAHGGTQQVPRSASAPFSSYRGRVGPFEGFIASPRRTLFIIFLIAFIFSILFLDLPLCYEKDVFEAYSFDTRCHSLY